MPKYELKDIHAQIENVAKDVPGWSPPDQLFALFNLVFLTSHLKGDVVEVGSWCGRSTVVLSQAARLTGNTIVPFQTSIARSRDQPRRMLVSR